jgi:D-alanine-D-alanine ligase
MEQWPQRLQRYFEGVENWWREKPRVAVVRNRWNRNVIGRLGESPSSRYRRRSVQHILDALRNEGFNARVFEGDLGLPAELRKYMSPNSVTGRPGGLVLNLSTGAQGNAMGLQLPALLELAGIAYSGPDPLAQALLNDRYAMLTLLSSSGIRVPKFRLAVEPGKPADYTKVEHPLVIRSRFDPSVSHKVRSREQLERVVAEMEGSYPHSALIEAYVSGRDIRVSILGNETLECLPLLERVKAGTKICPAALTDRRADRIREYAMRVYRLTGCRDYARIDLRIPKRSRKPIVRRVTWDNLLAQRGSFVRSAEVAGYSYQQLLHRIVDEALLRYGLKPDLRADITGLDFNDSNVDADKRVVAR